MRADPDASSMTSMSTAETNDEEAIIPSVVVQDEDVEADPVGYEWYNAPDAGGYELCYGKLAGRKLNELDECSVRRERANSKVRDTICLCIALRLWQDYDLGAAAACYLYGLEQYTTDHYGEFLVPFKSKYNNHQGLRIDRCRDKTSFNVYLRPEYKYLRLKVKYTCLISKNYVLTVSVQYSIYFKAVEQFLEHPSHPVAIRNVGELTGYESSDESYTPANDNENLGFSYRVGGPSQSAPITIRSASDYVQHISIP